jgi:ribosomal protein S18 acetylase RimI-like enzyme
MSPPVAPVRRAGPADLDLLVTLQAHVHAPHVAREPHRYRPSEPAQVRGWLSEMIDHDDVVVLLCGEAGYCLCVEQRRPASPFTHPHHSLHVDQLAVAPDHRGRGIGRALMAAAEELGRTLGCAELDLTVRADNAGARAFYAALGYAPRQLRLGKELG